VNYDTPYFMETIYVKISAFFGWGCISGALSQGFLPSRISACQNGAQPQPTHPLDSNASELEHHKYVVVQLDNA
jgi:hypothetical protein